MSENEQAASSSNEFEREPVPGNHLLGFKSFIGMYAGEHCAGTELMIGPLFVACGVSAFDLIVGLLVGNALAVLSWMFLTAPIATRSRLTLYYQLEKICGRRLVTIYNLLNGVMFCFLAGAMITVSATAIGVWFKFPMPTLQDYLPNSVSWCVAVFVVGMAISIVAAFGYRIVAKFANIAAPWMVLVFLAFGLIALKQFIDSSDAEIHSLGELWTFAETVLWKGGEPLAGNPKFTIWHITFFAWFCNMAMHVGMADLSVFRFAKKSWFAVATSAGMYVGHFMAWIAASLLFAYQLHVTPDNESVLPGPLAAQAAGLTGLLCVIIAGWTTANPTIYRAGLAFQAILPKSKRFVVTLVTGLIATIAGMFPAFAMQLLDFVALYGLILMPMGAVVFVDFWFMKKLGLKDNYAEQVGSSFNLAAGFTYFLTVGICLALVQWCGIQIYFVSLPGWFIAVALYIAFSAACQKLPPSVLRSIGTIMLIAAIIGTVLPPVLYLAGAIPCATCDSLDAASAIETPQEDVEEVVATPEELDPTEGAAELAEAEPETNAAGFDTTLMEMAKQDKALEMTKWFMLIATIVWFIVAPIMMWNSKDEVE